MENNLLLKHAIELLDAVNPNDLETVQINHTKYDDGSIGFSVELTYPAEDKEEVNIITEDGELIASVSKDNAIVKDGFKVSGYNQP